MRTVLYFVAGAVALAFGVLVFLSLVGILHDWKVPTGSMSPTIKPGDCIYSENLSYRFRKPRRGEIVCFKTNGIAGIAADPAEPERIIVWEKRIIGLPGDKLKMRYGELLVNGKADPALASLKVSPGRTYLTNDGVLVVVPPDSYFVVGDNTHNSFDSRYWGVTDRSSIIGKPLFVYWSYESDPFNSGHLSVKEWLQSYVSIALHFFNRTRWFRFGTVIR